jgi:hypothetical protein
VCSGGSGGGRKHNERRLDMTFWIAPRRRLFSKVFYVHRRRTVAGGGAGGGCAGHRDLGGDGGHRRVRGVQTNGEGSWGCDVRRRGRLDFAKNHVTSEFRKGQKVGAVEMGSGEWI